MFSLQVSISVVVVSSSKKYVYVFFYVNNSELSLIPPVLVIQNSTASALTVCRLPFSAAPTRRKLQTTTFGTNLPANSRKTVQKEQSVIKHTPYLRNKNYHHQQAKSSKEGRENQRSIYAL
jgi:hypothetical protein